MKEIECYLESDPNSSGPYRRLDIDLANGYVPQEINLGFPEIRNNNDKRPNADGEDDYTEFTGASAVQLKLAIFGDNMPTPLSDQKIEDNLRSWMHPKRRSRLVYRRRGEDAWRFCPIRSAGVNRSLQLSRTRFGEIVLTWRNPTGFSWDLEESTKYLSYGGNESGRTYDLTFDRTYPASSVIGQVDVFNAGNVDVAPVVHIHGPANDFRLDNLTLGVALKFKSTFALLAGEFLVVDMDAGSVYLNNDISNSRFNQIDTPNNTWWKLAEGLNLLRPVAAGYTFPAAHMEIFWRNAYI